MNSKIMVVALLPRISAPVLPFTLQDIVKSLNFSHNFSNSNRFAILFGEKAYHYGCVHHIPLNIVSNSFIEHIYHSTAKIFPWLKFNTVLVNYYPTSKSVINFHSDDEKDIIYNSYILTFSIGATRNLTLAFKHTNKPIYTAKLENLQYLIFTKISQDYFSHGILNDGQSCCSGPRLSFTFRMISQ